MRDAAAVRALVRRGRPDVVINASAYNKVDAAESEPAEALAVNAAGPLHLARACARGGRAARARLDRLRLRRRQQRSRTARTTAPRPLSVYGVSKLAGELLVRPPARRPWSCARAVSSARAAAGPRAARSSSASSRARAPASRCASWTTRSSRPPTRRTSRRGILALVDARRARPLPRHQRRRLHLARAGGGRPRARRADACRSRRITAAGAGARRAPAALFGPRQRALPRAGLAAAAALARRARGRCCAA